MVQIRNDTYTFSIPDNWESIRDETISSVYNPQGHGALTITSYSSLHENQDCLQVLERFTQGRGIPRVKETLDGQVMESRYEEYSKDDSRTVIVWVFCRGKILVVVSYNCLSREINDEELSVVENIIDSFNFQIT